MLLAKFHEEPPATFEAAVADAPGEDEFLESLLNTLAIVLNAPNRIVLVLKGDSWEQLAECAANYVAVAKSFGSTVRLGFWKNQPVEDQLHPDDVSEKGEQPVDDPRYAPISPATKEEADNLLLVKPSDFGNLAIELTGGHAAMRFSSEVGLHVFNAGAGEKNSVAVGFFDEGEALEDAWLPNSMLRDHDYTQISQRRLWDTPGRRMLDLAIRREVMI